MWVTILNLLLLFPALGLTLPLGQNNTETSTFVCESEPDDIEEFLSPTSGLKTRSFLLNRARRWINGIVPYEIDRAFTKAQVAKIKDSMKMFSDVSCVRWVPRKNQKDYVRFVHFFHKQTCNSLVGRRGGAQFINLGDACFSDFGYQGAIPHEMMHAIGFIHEQQRLDRDCFVEVTRQASVSKKFDYGVVPDTDTGFPYDFGSIMHYGDSKNMKALKGERLGNYDGKFTYLDKMKLNNMYCGGPTFCRQNPTQCAVYQRAEKQCRLGFSNFFSIPRRFYRYYY